MVGKHLLPVSHAADSCVWQNKGGKKERKDRRKERRKKGGREEGRKGGKEEGGRKEKEQKKYSNQRSEAPSFFLIFLVPSTDKTWHCTDSKGEMFLKSSSAITAQGKEG